MPTTRHAIRELGLKIIYLGPGRGGKTTNLQQLYKTAQPHRRGRLVSFSAAGERTMFFDLLPLELGVFLNYRVRLHVCTAPGQLVYARTRQLVMRGVDGIVFVADSHPERLEANVASLNDLVGLLDRQGRALESMPFVVQYNKRDLQSVSSFEELRESLVVPAHATEIASAAKLGLGVVQTLKEITKRCLEAAGDPRLLPEGRYPSMLPLRAPLAATA